MKRLEDQFKLFTPQLKAPADGPDCVEGGVQIINEKDSTNKARQQSRSGELSITAKKILK